MKRKFTDILLTVFIISGLLFLSCKKFVEVDLPIDQLTSETVFTNESTATSAILGIYSQMMFPQPYMGSGAVTIYGGLYSDELVSSRTFNGSEMQFSGNDLQPDNTILYFNMWHNAYRFIYQANSCIEGLTNNPNIPETSLKQLTGEAKFIRAYIYFYLTNLFGDVPLLTKPDYNENAVLPRDAQVKIYELIVNDLEQASAQLPADYISDGHTRPNKFAALTLLSRVYLYLQQWQKAEAAADQVVQSGLYELLPDLSQVFLVNSQEAVWQLYPVGGYFNTAEGISFVPFSSTVIPPYFLTDTLLHSFEPGDNRLAQWTGLNTANARSYYYPKKYKLRYTSDITESYVMLRYAEAILNRAEARAQQGKIGEGLTDMNTIRERAGLSALVINDAAALIDAVYKERKTELFAEWAHRWFDLKRTGQADAVLGILKPGWVPTDSLFPIPQAEILLNPSLTQNPGF